MDRYSEFEYIEEIKRLKEIGKAQSMEIKGLISEINKAMQEQAMVVNRGVKVD